MIWKWPEYLLKYNTSLMFGGRSIADPGHQTQKTFAAFAVVIVDQHIELETVFPCVIAVCRRRNI